MKSIIGLTFLVFSLISWGQAEVNNDSRFARLIISQNGNMNYDILYLNSTTQVELSNLSDDYALNACYLGNVDKVKNILRRMSDNVSDDCAVDVKSWDTKKLRRSGGVIKFVNFDAFLSCAQGVVEIKRKILPCLTK